MITGAQIRDARKRAGLSQAELAKRVGVVPRTVGGWERGETSPSIAEQRLMEVLRNHLDNQEAATLEDVSDIELLAEIARRLARSAAADRGVVYHTMGSGKSMSLAQQLIEHAEDVDALVAARRTGRNPSGQQQLDDEERAAELGKRVVAESLRDKSHQSSQDAGTLADEKDTG